MKAMLTDGQRELGRAVVDSIWASSGWCFRKVESVELLEGVRARRRVSLDCMPPPERHLAYESAERRRWRGPRGAAMVPLAFVAKGVVRNLDTEGPDGQPLPVLGREENGELAFAALAYQYEREVGAITARLRDELRAVVFGDPVEAEAAVGRLFPVSTETDEVEFGGVSGPLIDLAIDLARNFLLVVLVPRELVGTRTVLKFSFDWTALRSRAGLGRSLLASAGYRTQPFRLDVGDPSWAASYHLEVRVQVPLTARFLHLPPADVGEEPAGSAQGADTLIHASASYPDGPPPDREATLEVRVEPTSIRLVGILVSLFTCAVFQLALWLDGARDALLGAPDGAVAVLLAAPAVGIALLAGAGESHLGGIVAPPTAGDHPRVRRTARTGQRESGRTPS
ncbi:hypothetical protein [Nocardioides sp. L-11A]|uniref:hypothetical protein n=1 Tax=Nocardioides sp. L-11A TaxID=3043848 RepID=UPI00249CBCC5|nr:hypothetical protein QJ852_19985 [Nocardioides sp. L-11A]